MKKFLKVSYKYFREVFSEIFYLDKRSLALFRILLGTVVLVDLLNRLTDIKDFFSEDGVLPINLALRETGINNSFSLNLINPGIGFQFLIFVVAMILSVLLILGFKTKFTTLLLWIFIVSIHNRNPMILNGGDVLLRIVLFLSILLPLGDVFSLDAKLKYQTAKVKKYISFSSFAFILQILFVYFFAALIKDGDDWTKNYTATYYALSLEQYTTFIGEYIVKFYNLTKALTISVYYVELFIILVFMIPIYNWVFRLLGILTIISIHIGFGSSLHVGIFPWISVTVILALLPSEFWKYLGNFYKKRSFKFQSKICGYFEKLYSILFKRFEKKEKSKRDSFYKNYLLGMIGLTFITLSLLWNIGTVQSKYDLPQNVKDVMIFLRLGQYWSMFAPNPAKDDGWLVIEGTYYYENKFIYEVNGITTTFDKPKNVSRTFENSRWRKYIRNIVSEDFTYMRDYFGEFACKHYQNGSLDSVKVWYVNVFNEDHYKKNDPTYILLTQKNCEH